MSISRYTNDVPGTYVDVVKDVLNSAAVHFVTDKLVSHFIVGG
jgi:hypothetical protein